MLDRQFIPPLLAPAPVLDFPLGGASMASAAIGVDLVEGTSPGAVEEPPSGAPSAATAAPAQGLAHAHQPTQSHAAAAEHPARQVHAPDRPHAREHAAAVAPRGGAIETPPARPPGGRVALVEVPEAVDVGETAAATGAAEQATGEQATGGQAVDEQSRSGYEAYERAPLTALGLSRDELVDRYAHLVKYVVGRLGVSVPGLFDHEDAMQAGVLGLLRAIDAYKPEAAASFESYAILRIRGSILDAVRSLDTVGRAGREAARAIQSAIRDLQHEHGRSPTESEVAARLGLSVSRYRERLQAASVVTVSLDERDARDGDEDQAVLADTAADPNAVDPEDEATRRDTIASLVHEIGRLAARPRTVLALYYQDEMTFKEIGQVLGVTESRICQIHTEAILSLRGRLVEPDLVARLARRRARA